MAASGERPRGAFGFFAQVHTQTDTHDDYDTNEGVTVK
jgi:hypothetical protein